jgi:hypothetical protein
LASLEARISLVDYIESTLAPHNLAIGVTVLKSLEGRYNFHFKALKNLDLHPLSQSFFQDSQEELSSVAFSPCVRQQEEKL